MESVVVTKRSSNVPQLEIQNLKNAERDVFEKFQKRQSIPLTEEEWNKKKTLLLTDHVNCLLQQTNNNMDDEEVIRHLYVLGNVEAETDPDFWPKYCNYKLKKDGHLQCFEDEIQGFADEIASRTAELDACRDPNQFPLILLRRDSATWRKSKLEEYLEQKRPKAPLSIHVAANKEQLDETINTVKKAESVSPKRKRRRVEDESKEEGREENPNIVKERMDDGSHTVTFGGYYVEKKDFPRLAKLHYQMVTAMNKYQDLVTELGVHEIMEQCNYQPRYPSQSQEVALFLGEEAERLRIEAEQHVKKQAEKTQEQKRQYNRDKQQESRARKKKAKKYTQDYN